MKILKKKFKRSVGELKNIFLFIDGFMAKYRVHNAVVQDVSLAVEEIFTNMVKYNPEGPPDLELGLSLNDNTLRIELTDIEKKPFDPTRAEVYDLNQSLEDRPVGRLGIYFVKKVMDRLEYDHQKEKSVITMIKNLGENDV
jgi:anti-sigma regulatory factor (Ser/Thr protein kinase)